MKNTQNNRIIFYGIKYFPSRGGTSRVAESLIKQLVSDHKITIYCYKHPQADKNIDGVKTIQIPKIPAGAAGVFIFYLLSAVHMLFTQNKHSIVHAHKTDCAFFLPLLKIKFKKIIATSHEAPYHRDKWNSFGKFYFRLMEWFFIHSGTILTTISKPLSEYYENRYNKKVVFIPNGINPDLTTDINSAKKLLNDFDIDFPFIIFSARRIMSTKGLHTMLEALSLLQTTLPIVIAGDPNHAKNYISNLKKKYNHLQLKFIGYVDLPVLLGLIKQAKLFIFPSEIEGMSIMLLEVMTVGAPIICSDIPENQQIFSEEDVLFFKNKDAFDLKNKIEFAFDNGIIMNKYIKNAQVKINKHYQWETISLHYKELYQNSQI